MYIPWYSSLRKQAMTDLDNSLEPVDDVNKSLFKFLLVEHRPYVSVCIVLPISLGVIVFTIAYSTGEVLTILCAPIMLLLGALSVTNYILVQSKLQNRFYTALAASLGCTYLTKVTVPPGGQLFSFNRNYQVTNVLSCTYNCAALELGDYRFVTGSGKTRTEHYYIVGVLSAEWNLPHIMCVPKGWLGFMREVSWQPRGTKVLPIEVGFNEKFVVYVPQDQEIETLQILEPNVMAELMDDFGSYGFECVGSKVYVFTEGSVKESRDAVTKLFSLLKHFSDVLTPELQNFKKDQAIGST